MNPLKILHMPLTCLQESDLLVLFAQQFVGDKQNFESIWYPTDYANVPKNYLQIVNLYQTQWFLESHAITLCG